mmetsp:Transcript_34479/g.107715  ORF Transcript_34479/g.107715 Transcript_34479/m.107715 type:complete len:166 (+) Transcript_34479:118-615(+)
MMVAGGVCSFPGVAGGPALLTGAGPEAAAAGRKRPLPGEPLCGAPEKRARPSDNAGLEALQQAAYLRHIAGDARGARRLYEEALRRCPASDLRVIAEVLCELGGACAADGDLLAAQQHSEAACRLFARLLPEDHPTLQSLVGRLYSLASAVARPCPQPPQTLAGL